VCRWNGVGSSGEDDIVGVAQFVGGAVISGSNYEFAGKV
jgi:hypothetical protein